MLHIVDVNTGLKKAVFVENKSAENLCDHFILSWFRIFSGYANKIRLDQENYFLSWTLRAEDQFKGM